MADLKYHHECDITIEISPKRSSRLCNGLSFPSFGFSSRYVLIKRNLGCFNTSWEAKKRRIGEQAGQRPPTPPPPGQAAVHPK